MLRSEAVEAAGIYGLGVFTEPVRSHPMGELAAPLVGFVAPDGVGVSGLEHQCDAWLRGESAEGGRVQDPGMLARIARRLLMRVTSLPRVRLERRTRRFVVR